VTGVSRSAVDTPRGKLVSCACGARPSETGFAQLGAVRVLDAEALEGVVVRWPRGVVVDVRLCDNCGGTIARLAGSRSAT
jgi:hypothetical protein